MPAYIAKTPIRHDGKDYAEGEPIELSAAVARSLLAAHAVAPAKKLSKAEEDQRRLQEEQRLKAEGQAGQMTEPQREALNVEVAQLLEGAVDKIIEIITGRDDLGVVNVLDAHLAAILSAEQNGKARKTLIAAIEEEQLRRMEATQGQA